MIALKYRFILVLPVLFGFSGCTMTNNVHEKIENTEQKIDAYKSDQDKNRATTNDGVWIPSKVIAPVEDSYNPIIAKLEAEEYTLRGYYDEINNLSSKIAEITRIPVIVEQGSTNQTQLAGSSATSSSAEGVAIAPPSGTSLTKLPFSYDGDLKGLLDLAASRFNVEWEWLGNGERIRFFKTKSQVFKLNSLPGMSTYQASVGKALSTEDSSASKFESSTNSDMSIWDSVTNSVEAMLTSNGRVVASHETGTFIVVDTPVSLKAISKYFDFINEMVVKQVAINITVLSVDTSESEDYGINWNAAYSSIADNLGGSLSSSMASPASAAQIGFNVISGDFQGSDLLISALREQAKITNIQHYNAVTINNKPAPISIVTSELILGQSSTALDGGQSLSTQQIDEYDYGFNLSFLPNIIDTGTLLLQVDLDMSRQVERRTVVSGDTTYELPTKKTQSTQRSISINSGDTLLITGFEEIKSSSQEAGLSKYLGLLGNSVSNEDGRSTVVVLVEPVILD